jgi:hypothetical protein
MFKGKFEKMADTFFSKSFSDELKGMDKTRVADNINCMIFCENVVSKQEY